MILNGKLKIYNIYIIIGKRIVQQLKKQYFMLNKYLQIHKNINHIIMI